MPPRHDPSSGTSQISGSASSHASKASKVLGKVKNTAKKVATTIEKAFDHPQHKKSHTSSTAQVFTTGNPYGSENPQFWQLLVLIWVLALDICAPKVHQNLTEKYTPQEQGSSSVWWIMVLSDDGKEPESGQNLREVLFTMCHAVVYFWSAVQITIAPSYPTQFLGTM
ncbi:hypothetical protein DFH08DRAFT_815037 [Mycena albidolilacea]|uniref:Uncharacterized protein n=1 Tax=Mycena albidolilacea TaxID=1033008 RepID=A0AAD6ZNZ1_9AGAR|nr:hypothetical protein DFH08DRAFT_815037 [Mycena albidolilacea]